MFTASQADQGGGTSGQVRKRRKTKSVISADIDSLFYLSLYFALFYSCMSYHIICYFMLSALTLYFFMSLSLLHFILKLCKNIFFFINICIDVTEQLFDDVSSSTVRSTGTR